MAEQILTYLGMKCHLGGENSKLFKWRGWVTRRHKSDTFGEY